MEAILVAIYYIVGVVGLLIIAVNEKGGLSIADILIALIGATVWPLMLGLVLAYLVLFESDVVNKMLTKKRWFTPRRPPSCFD